MTDQLKNFAISTVATAPSPQNTGTSLIVTAGQGARFPTPPFSVVVWPAGDPYPTPDTAETVRVTATSGDTFTTIIRGQESSTPRFIQAGDIVMLAVTAGLLGQIQQAAEDTVAAGPQVLAGVVDPLSGDGADGDYFLQTSSGSLYGPKTAGNWGTPILLKGLPVLSGTGGPSSSDGADGDYYLDPANSLIYGPKVGGSWPSGVPYMGSHGKGFIAHGSTASTARPVGYESVEWVGSVAPTHAVTGDTWVNTA